MELSVAKSNSQFSFIEWPDTPSGHSFEIIIWKRAREDST